LLKMFFKISSEFCHAFLFYFFWIFIYSRMRDTESEGAPRKLIVLLGVMCQPKEMSGELSSWEPDFRCAYRERACRNAAA